MSNVVRDIQIEEPTMEDSLFGGGMRTDIRKEYRGIIYIYAYTGLYDVIGSLEHETLHIVLLREIGVTAARALDNSWAFARMEAVGPAVYPNEITLRVAALGGIPEAR
jgi:hypothetical protein